MSDWIFPPELALAALQSGAYKNTAYALAEVIDNSYEAGATDIQVCLFSDEIKSGSSRLGEIHTIAVLDNGSGMDNAILKRSVQYGFGKRASGAPLNRKRELGKFGVGLLAASFSQSKELQVMSWQEGIINKHVPSVGFSIIKESKDQSIENNILPEPISKAIPEYLTEAFSDYTGGYLHKMEKGTIVIWRKVSQSWKQPKTLAKALAFECGRIYRNFIRTEQLRIRISMHNAQGKQDGEHIEVLAVDPLFLHHWEDPALKDFKSDTLFQANSVIPGDEHKNQDGTVKEREITVKLSNGIEGKCRLLSAHRRLGVVVDHANELGFPDPGRTKYGKLAKKLQGVSILRSGREIELDEKWIRTDRTVDRWLGVSLDFDPALDSYFGVSNDKQRATKIARFAAKSLKDLNEERNELKSQEQGEIFNSEEISLYSIAIIIKTELAEMVRKVRMERIGGRRSGNGIVKHTGNDPTVATITELVEASTSVMKRDKLLPAKDFDDRKKALIDALTGSITDSKKAEEIRPTEIINYKLKFDMVSNPSSSSNSYIFDSIHAGDTVIVRMNEKHPLYGRLSELLARDIGYYDFHCEEPNASEPAASSKIEMQHEYDKARKLVEDYRKTIRFMLLSLARAEEENKDQMSQAFEDVRIKWGRVAADVFNHGKDD